MAHQNDNIPKASNSLILTYGNKIRIERDTRQEIQQHLSTSQRLTIDLFSEGDRYVIRRTECVEFGK